MAVTVIGPPQEPLNIRSSSNCSINYRHNPNCLNKHNTISADVFNKLKTFSNKRYLGLTQLGTKFHEQLARRACGRHNSITLLTKWRSQLFRGRGRGVDFRKLASITSEDGGICTVFVWYRKLSLYPSFRMLRHYTDRHTKQRDWNSIPSLNIKTMFSHSTRYQKDKLIHDSIDQIRL